MLHKQPREQALPFNNALFQKILSVAFWLACLAVATLSLLPVTELPPITLDLWDKAQHAVGFFVLGSLGLLAYPRHFARVCLGLLLFGVVIEIAQALSGWRTGDWLDWLADAVGLALAAVSMHQLSPTAR